MTCDEDSATTQNLCTTLYPSDTSNIAELLNFSYNQLLATTLSCV